MIRTLTDIWRSLNKSEKKHVQTGLTIISIVGIVSIFILPFIFVSRFSEHFNYTTTGNIGDTVNGIAGPFIALFAAFLTFVAFYIQYRANIQQREQFNESLNRQKEEAKDREKTWLIERFESRFYELIRLHKANVNEMNISDRFTGSNCFVPMFYELRHCYIIVSNEYEGKYKADIDIMSLAYKLFFYGVGDNSEKYYVQFLNQEETKLFEVCKKKIEDIQNNYYKKTHSFNSSAEGYIDTIYYKSKEVKTTFYYWPFNGHVSRLGHYYRHLFQTVNYVKFYNNIEHPEKYSYIKTLRAQVTNFEQLLLYYNASAWFISGWQEAFVDYRFIKNIPLPIADFHITPEERFKEEILKCRKEGNEMFEWLE